MYKDGRQEFAQSAAQTLDGAVNFLIKIGEKGFANLADFLHGEEMNPRLAAHRAMYLLDDYLDNNESLNGDKLGKYLYCAAQGDHSHDDLWHNEILPRIHVSGLRLNPLMNSRDDAQHIMSYLAESYMLEPLEIPESILADMREHAVRLSKKVVDNESDAIFMARMSFIEQGTPFSRQYLAFAYEYFTHTKTLIEKSFPLTDIEDTAFGAFVSEECRHLALHYQQGMQL